MPLQDVHFGGCKLLTDKALEILKKMLLQRIYFDYCYRLTDKVFEHLKEMPLLREARFANYNLTDKAEINFREHYYSIGLLPPTVNISIFWYNE